MALRPDRRGARREAEIQRKGFQQHLASSQVQAWLVSAVPASTLQLPSKLYFRNYRLFGSSSENKINDSRSANYGRFMLPQTVKNKLISLPLPKPPAALVCCAFCRTGLMRSAVFQLQPASKWVCVKLMGPSGPDSDFNGHPPEINIWR